MSLVNVQKLKEMRWKRKFRELPLGLKILKKTLFYLGLGKCGKTVGRHSETRAANQLIICKLILDFYLLVFNRRQKWFAFCVDDSRLCYASRASVVGSSSLLYELTVYNRQTT